MRDLRDRGASAAAIAAVAAVVVATAAAGPALAAERITAAPTLGGRLGGPGSLSVRVAVASTPAGIPSPLARLVVEVPPGPTYNFDTTPVCPPGLVAAAAGSTPPACPPGSQIGTGSAAVEAALGSTLLDEMAALDIYLTGHDPVTFEVWASATSPIAETLTIPASFAGAPAPFGRAITIEVPPIATVPGGPDASIVSLAFTVGGTHLVTATRAVRRGGRTVRRPVRTSVGLFVLPTRCPSSTPYAVSATFLDASTVTVAGQLRCPA